MITTVVCSLSSHLRQLDKPLIYNINNLEQPQEYRIYSNRSRTPNSSHPRIVAAPGAQWKNSSRTHARTQLSGCGHDWEWNALAHSGQNHGRRQPWFGSTIAWELLWRLYIDYLKYNLRKTSLLCYKFCVKYLSEINKSRPWLVAASKWGWN